jgi:hypothetical protein
VRHLGGRVTQLITGYQGVVWAAEADGRVLGVRPKNGQILHVMHVPRRSRLGIVGGWLAAAKGQLSSPGSARRRRQGPARCSKSRACDRRSGSPSARRVRQGLEAIHHLGGSCQDPHHPRRSWLRFGGKTAQPAADGSLGRLILPLAPANNELKPGLRSSSPTDRWRLACRKGQRRAPAH